MFNAELYGAKAVQMHRSISCFQHNVGKSRPVRECTNVFHVLCWLVTALGPLFVIHEGSWVKRPSYNAHFFSSLRALSLSLATSKKLFDN